MKYPISLPILTWMISLQMDELKYFQSFSLIIIVEYRYSYLIVQFTLIGC